MTDNLAARKRLAEQILTSHLRQDSLICELARALLDTIKELDASSIKNSLQPDQYLDMNLPSNKGVDYGHRSIAEKAAG